MADNATQPTENEKKADQPTETSKPTEESKKEETKVEQTNPETKEGKTEEKPKNEEDQPKDKDSTPATPPATPAEQKKEETKEEEKIQTRPRSQSQAELKKAVQIAKENKLAYLQSQSIPVGPEVKGETRARRNAHYSDALLETDGTGVTTLYENLLRTAEIYGDRPGLGAIAGEGDKKAFQFLTYKEVLERVHNFASGLINLGMKPKDKLGLFSKNRVEWLLAEEAGNSQSMPSVAIYDTFGEDAISYIINHAELEYVICSNWKETTSKIVTVADKCKSLKVIIQMDPFNEEEAGKVTAKNLKLVSFADIEKDGKENPKPPTPPKADDLSVIMYTSGTTGDPKGVLHTHKSLLATCFAVTIMINNVEPTDRFLSYLPLAHIFERACIGSMIHGGAAVGFFSGDTRTLVDDIQLLKPTLLAGVPRVFERVYQRITSAVDQSGFFKKTLFKAAFNSKKKNLQSKKHLFEEAEKSTSIYNKYVLNNVKSRLGGHLRLIISGGAPLSPATHEFLKVCFGCPVLQGYGLTETSAGTSISDPDDPEIGHIGPPIPCCEIKLVDVDDMGYHASDIPPRGEVCVRGPNISLGYYKDEKKTAEDFDKDGWFHTGDVGRLNPTGTFSIIDRKKNIFKLSQGEYVAAEKLELIYARSRFVGQLFVYGDSFTPFLIAIVRPEEDFVKRWAADNKIPDAADFQAVCKNPALAKAIKDDFTTLNKDNKLTGFERIEAVIVTPLEWTPQNDLVTPKMSLRRPQLKNYYLNDIVDAYTDLNVDLPYADQERVKARKELNAKKKKEEDARKEAEKKEAAKKPKDEPKGKEEVAPAKAEAKAEEKPAEKTAEEPKKEEAKTETKPAETKAEATTPTKKEKKAKKEKKTKSPEKAKPAESQPAEAKPAEETKPAETKPAEEPKKEEAKPAETKPAEQPKETNAEESTKVEEPAKTETAKTEEPAKSEEPEKAAEVEAPKAEEPAKTEEPVKTEEPPVAPEQTHTYAEAAAEAVEKEDEVKSAEETKIEEPKVEGTKAEEPKSEETKAEEPKAEETKAEETKVEEPKAEETKEEPKVEESKTEETKAEEPKVEETKTEEAETEETNEEESAQEDAEEAKTEETKEGETSTGGAAPKKKRNKKKRGGNKK
eukprot:TRINITY_DN72_c0_g1_i3.p1 TRINITY_DN72_c0_g1~~TRINITY_DN72_c0_g1_i3.p1  ORF type:complete len:1130 (-),score=527.02 TRINITY_DN72_c0_g1_i3:24-3413(-)